MALDVDWAFLPGNGTVPHAAQCPPGWPHDRRGGPVAASLSRQIAGKEHPMDTR